MNLNKNIYMKTKQVQKQGAGRPVYRGSVLSDYASDKARITISVERHYLNILKARAEGTTSAADIIRRAVAEYCEAS